jgi:beta-N-acetylhexosaminidase
MADDLTRAVNGVLLAGFTGTQPPPWLLDACAAGLAGVVYFAHNTPDLATTAALSDRLHTARPELIVAVDEEGGDVSRLQAVTGSALPGAGALGAVDDPELTRRAAHALGDMLAAAGVDLNLAPVLDVNSAADNPVIGVRAFGTTPELVSRHGVAFLAGLHDAGIAACGKHFPGHGATTVDSHLGLPVVTDDLATVAARDLPPFAAAVTAGVDALMTAHIVVPALGGATGTPATLDARVLARARALGLRGPIITDALDMGAVFHDPGFGEACVRALLAGADLLCLGTTLHRDDEALYRAAHAALTAAVRSGRLRRERVAEAATRIARLRGATRAVRPDAAAAEARLAQLGAEAASRALRWAGEPAPLAAPAAPVVVDLRTRLNHAAGRIATHLSNAVLSAWPAAVAADTVPDDGPVLLVTRDAANDPAERDRLTAALATRPDAVVLHAGTAASAPSARHVLLTWGTGRANASAAVAALRA